MKPHASFYEFSNKSIKHARVFAILGDLPAQQLSRPAKKLAETIEFLNMFFYPLTPVIYGFGVQKELGRRLAIWSIFCAACFVALIVTAIAMGSE